jgi:hypothetical protein
MGFVGAALSLELLQVDGVRPWRTSRSAVVYSKDERRRTHGTALVHDRRRRRNSLSPWFTTIAVHRCPGSQLPPPTFAVAQVHDRRRPGPTRGHRVPRRFPGTTMPLPRSRSLPPTRQVTQMNPQ